MKKNIRTNTILFRASRKARSCFAGKSRKLSVVILLLSFFFITKPTFATSRLTIPLASHATLVIENKNGVDTQIAAISDSLSSTKAMLSSEGTTTSTPIYYPYGAQKETLADSLNNRYFTGQRKVDENDNLYNYNARYYSPETGVFTQPDSVEGPNRFAYVTGNPILHNDPTGHCVQCNVFWMQGITGEHPWTARDRSESPALHDLARIDAWTGIPSLLVSIDGQENGLDTMMQESKQFTSKSEAEASFMVNMGLAVAGSAKGLIGLEQIGAQGLSKGGGAQNLLTKFAADESGQFLPARSRNNFTVRLMTPDPDYERGLMSYVNQWKGDRRIEPYLMDNGKLPYANPITGGYAEFKARFKGIYGKREYDRRYWGLFAEVNGEDFLRISPQNPGIVKHGMLTSGTPVDIAGEFSYGWTRGTRGEKYFHLYEVNLSSGGYTPRTYSAKLQYARNKLEQAILPQ